MASQGHNQLNSDKCFIFDSVELEKIPFHFKQMYSTTMIKITGHLMHHISFILGCVTILSCYDISIVSWVCCICRSHKWRNRVWWQIVPHITIINTKQPVLVDCYTVPHITIINTKQPVLVDCYTVPHITIINTKQPVLVDCYTVPHITIINKY